MSAACSPYLCRSPDCDAPQGTGPRAESTVFQLRRDQSDPGLPQQMPQRRPQVSRSHSVQNAGEMVELVSVQSPFSSSSFLTLSGSA